MQSWSFLQLSSCLRKQSLAQLMQTGQIRLTVRSPTLDAQFRHSFAHLPTTRVTVVVALAAMSYPFRGVFKM